MSNILVTGATGFIGQHLVPQLQSLGHNVRCAVWQCAPHLSAEQVIVNKMDSFPDWSEALKDIEIIIHLAARVHVLDKKGSLSLGEFCKINSEATKHFAEQATAQGVKRFVFLSTIKVHGDFSVKGKPFTEESPENSPDPYAKSKWLAEEYLRNISQTTGLEVVILRPPLVYGPGVKANFLRLLEVSKKGWPLPFGKVSNQRSFVYIDNLISAIHAVLIAPEAEGRCFLVSDNESWSLASLLKTMAQIMNKRARLWDIPMPVLYKLLNLIGKKQTAVRLLESLEVNNAEIKAVLDWNPPVTAQQGLQKTIEWYILSTPQTQR